MHERDSLTVQSQNLKEAEHHLVREIIVRRGDQISQEEIIRELEQA